MEHRSLVYCPLGQAAIFWGANPIHHSFIFCDFFFCFLFFEVTTLWGKLGSYSRLSEKLLCGPLYPPAFVLHYKWDVLASVAASLGRERPN